LAPRQHQLGCANGIDKLFAKELVATNVTADTGTFNKLCVSDSNGTSCYTRSQLDAAVAASAAAGAQNAGTGAPTAMPGAAATATSGPPIITINGNNPTTVSVGATYQDLGALITASQQDFNLGIQLHVDGTPTNAVSLDTTKPGTHKVDYVITDREGRTATSSCTVIVSAPTNDNTPATTTAATSSAQ
jgi:Domain of unknown function (DUF5011)